MPIAFGAHGAPSFVPGRFIGDVTLFDDFVGGRGSLGLADTARVATWDKVSVNGSALHDADGVNGVAELITTTGTGDDATLQLNGTPFSLSVGRDLYLETRFSVSAVTAYPFIGLAAPGFDPALGAAVAAHVGFSTAGDANLLFTSWQTGVAPNTVDTTTDLVADTFVTAAFHWVSHERQLRFYTEGVHRGTIAEAELPRDTAYTVILANNGNLAATTTHVDYIYVTMERDG